MLAISVRCFLAISDIGACTIVMARMYKIHMCICMIISRNTTCFWVCATNHYVAKIVRLLAMCHELIIVYYI